MGITLKFLEPCKQIFPVRKKNITTLQTAVHSKCQSVSTNLMFIGPYACIPHASIQCTKLLQWKLLIIWCLSVVISVPKCIIKICKALMIIDVTLITKSIFTTGSSHVRKSKFRASCYCVFNRLQKQNYWSYVFSLTAQ